MLNSSKKGTMLILPIVIGFILGLTVFLFAITSDEGNKYSFFIGDKQLLLLSTFELSKQHLLFIDLVGEHSSERAVLDLANNGGFGDTSACGSFVGYNMVNNLSDFCFSSNYRDGFFVFFNRSFVDYVNLYSSVFIPRDLFSVSLLNTNSGVDVVGFANDFLSIPIFSKTAVSAAGDFCPVPVDLTPITGISCVTSSSSCELSKDVVDRLNLAEIKAKSAGYDLLVTSARRTYQQQEFLYNKFGPKRAAFPSCKSPHVGGGAVDVVLTKDGKPVAGMSSGDGAMNDLSIGKRVDLQNIMCSAGFQRFSGEFWHFEYKTSRWLDPAASSRCILS